MFADLQPANIRFSLEIIDKKLHEAASKVMIHDDDGKSPLGYAESGSIVEILEFYGAIKHLDYLLHYKSMKGEKDLCAMSHLCASALM